MLATLALASPLLGSASARPASEGGGLELTERPAGTPLPLGSSVNDEQLSFGAGGCLQESGGIVRTNGKPMDRLLFEAPGYNSCEDGAVVLGGVHEVRMYADGEASLRMNPVLSVTTAGPCVYDFRRLNGSTDSSGIAYIHGVATGRRDRAASAKSCAHELTTEFAVSELGQDGYVLGAEKIG
jgi:hypothetical protein